MPSLSWDFIREQLGPVPPVVSADLAGKVVMVVGANTGIGFEACVHFARMKPAKLILTARTKAKGEDAVQRLAQQTSYRAEYKILELTKFSSVREFADEFEQTENRLDILVMNAGMVAGTYSATEDGWESTIQVNVLASSMVALRLLPVMENTAKAYKSRPRLVNVASGIHWWADWSTELQSSRTIFKDLSGKEFFLNEISKYVAMQYVNAKLLNIFFTRELANKVLAKDPSQQVIVDCLDPGLCRSGLGRDVTGWEGFKDWLLKRLLGYTAEQGSRQIIYAAVGGADSGEAAEKQLQGSYIHMSTVMDPSFFVTGEKGNQIQKQLWDETVEILGKVDPRIREVV